jgi:hypothetical protein
MDLHKLVNELRRAAAAIEQVLVNPERPNIQPGDIAQIRLDGHADHAGRICIVNRTTQNAVRATLLDVHRAGMWGTDLELTPAQLNYIGTPRLADAPQRYESNANARATALAPATPRLTAPAVPERKKLPKSSREPR